MDGGNHSLLFKFVAKYHQEEVGANLCSLFCAILIQASILEILLLVILSYCVHQVFKRLGQPSIISQMLVGLLLGPTILGKFNLVNNDENLLEVVANSARNLFMFLVGLEINISYLKKKLRRATITCAGSLATCLVLSAIVGPLLYLHIHSNGNKVVFGFTIFVLLFNTSSPILIGVVSELKLTMTVIGRLAISTAIITDTVCMLILAVLNLAYKNEKRSGGESHGSTHYLSEFSLFVLLIIVSIGLILCTKWINKRNQDKRVIARNTAFYLLYFVFVSAVNLARLGYDPMLAVFIFGLMIDREGPTATTITEMLTYLVHNLILPIFFGVAGLQVDFTMLRFKEVALTSLAVVMAATIGKIGGTMAAAKFLGMPSHQGLVLSFLLNIRGHVNLMVIYFAKTHELWSERTHMALLVSLFLSSVTSCPATMYIVGRRRRSICYRSKCLEDLNPEDELSILACVHSPNDVDAILDLINFSNSSTNCILHLTELTSNPASNMLYHQQHHQDVYDRDTVEGQQIRVTINSFVKETEIHIRHLTVISSFNTIHEDVKNRVVEMDASLAIVPFHRRPRFDGKMTFGKENIRHFNINALREFPCSVGILVNRGWDKGPIANEFSLQQSPDENRSLHAVVLFLGGPDDREAAAYASRLALHPRVNVTIFRFLPPPRQVNDGKLRSSHPAAIKSSSVEMEVKGNDPDDIFITNFYNKYVVRTKVLTYDEKLVEDQTKLKEALSSMKGMYSLYITGRQVQGPMSNLVMGMTKLEECPELGTVGDLLASSEFMLNGSVLVIQQGNASRSMF